MRYESLRCVNAARCDFCGKSSSDVRSCCATVHKATPSLGSVKVRWVNVDCRACRHCYRTGRRLPWTGVAAFLLCFVLPVVLMFGGAALLESWGSNNGHPDAAKMFAALAVGPMLLSMFVGMPFVAVIWRKKLMKRLFGDPQTNSTSRKLLSIGGHKKWGLFNGVQLRRKPGRGEKSIPLRLAAAVLGTAVCIFGGFGEARAQAAVHSAEQNETTIVDPGGRYHFKLPSDWKQAEGPNEKTLAVVHEKAGIRILIQTVPASGLSAKDFFEHRIVHTIELRRGKLLEGADGDKFKLGGRGGFSAAWLLFTPEAGPQSVKTHLARDDDKMVIAEEFISVKQLMRLPLEQRRAAYEASKGIIASFTWMEEQGRR